MVLKKETIFLRRKDHFQIVSLIIDIETGMSPVIPLETVVDIHSFSILSYDRSKASSKATSPHSVIQSFLLQMRVSSPFLKFIQ